MIPETQRKAIAVLAELCELSDDIRLGQLIAWLGELSEDQVGRGIWDVEDDELLAVMCRHREDLLRRLPESQQNTYRQKHPAPSISDVAIIPESSPTTNLNL
jgi:hypothetical protein